MVETQETAATLNLVDSMEEQDVLEQLLDEVKPPYREGTQGMHYLLKTAFRYPPLKYGSRFGTRLMPSFFYASETPETVLAETAYYRFVFLQDMQDAYQGGFDSSHIMFSVSLRSERCLDLCAAKFNSIKGELSSVQDYSHCQAVGGWAVQQRGAELIRYHSARHMHVLNEVANSGASAGVNLAVAEPDAIRSKAPVNRQPWLCRTTHTKISFSSREARFPRTFFLEQFMLNGKLPRPA